MSSGWSWYVVALVAFNILGCVWAITKRLRAFASRMKRARTSIPSGPRASKKATCGFTMPAKPSRASSSALQRAAAPCASVPSPQERRIALEGSNPTHSGDRSSAIRRKREQKLAGNNQGSSGL